MLIRQNSNRWPKSLQRFAGDPSGTTAIEYGIVSALIGLALVAVVGSLGTNLTGSFEGVGDTLKLATGSGNEEKVSKNTPSRKSQILKNLRKSN